MVEVWRSGFLESVHRGSLVVVGPDGGVLHAMGDVDRPVLPRSSNKPVQATVYLDAGWQPRDDRELALAAASHSGEDDHRELAVGQLTGVLDLGDGADGGVAAVDLGDEQQVATGVAGGAGGRA